jgi:hypothetical protein
MNLHVPNGAPLSLRLLRSKVATLSSKTSIVAHSPEQKNHSIHDDNTYNENHSDK